MARKHKRRTRKRNRKGGFLGPTMKAKMDEGLKGWGDGFAHAKKKGEEFRLGAQEAANQVQAGYNSKTGTGAGMMGPVPGPPATPPPMGPPMGPVMEPTKEKTGGLLGLGWFGLGGRRLSHSSFINKMLRVRSKTKRNKAIRKYLKGGKKKTKKRRGSKKRKTRRRRR